MEEFVLYFVIQKSHLRFFLFTILLNIWQCYNGELNYDASSQISTVLLQEQTIIAQPIGVYIYIYVCVCVLHFQDGRRQ